MQETICPSGRALQLFAPPQAKLKNKYKLMAEKQRICNYLLRLICPYLIVLVFFPNRGWSQEFECGSPDPSPEMYSKMQGEVQKVYQMSIQESSFSPIEIPVYFTVLRNANGIIPNIGDVTEADIEERLDFLNSKVAGTEFHFSRLGAVNYIDHDLFADGATSGLIKENYSYVNTAFNVYLRPGNGGFAPQPGQNLPNSLTKDNTLTLSAGLFMDDGETYSHETGHNFGLLHTFGSAQAYKYPDVKSSPSQIDHPYLGGFPRELAIRDDVAPGTKFFNLTNKFTAGDLCWDTEADCSSSAASRYAFPAFDATNIANCIATPNSINCLSGCHYPSCGYSGLYKDYNEDAIVGEPHNIMAVTYHSTCDVHFSDCQKSRMALTFQDFWKDKIDQNLLINVEDQVEYKGTADPLKNVVLRWRHPSTNKYTNCVSDKTGAFRGVLYDQTVTAEVRKIGSTREFAGIIPNPSGLGGTPYFIDAYTQDEWLEGLTTYDLVCISKHISAIEPFTNGYDIIAADANRSSSVTTFDIVEFRKLILGIYQKLPQHESPWVFVPEYIPQDYQIQFDVNPFSIDIDINNPNVSYTQYSTPNWQYNILSSNSGQRGYDGIKLGNVCGPMLAFCEPPIIAFNSPALLAPNQIFEIDIKAIGFDNIESFQMGMFLDQEKLEVLDVLSADLPEFSKEDNIGLLQLDEGNIKIAWFKSNAQPHTFSSEINSLFKIKVKTLQPISDSDFGEIINLGKEKGGIPTAFFDESGCVDGVQLIAVVNPLLGKGNDRSTIAKRSEFSSQDRESKLYCFPNPTESQVSIVFENITGVQPQQGAISILDTQGRTMITSSATINTGINTLTIDEGIQDLPGGIYNLILVSQENVRIGRFFKK